MIESIPICVARTPFEGTVAQNVLEYGTGAINIDGCRVEWDEKGLQGDTNRRKTPRTDITGEEFHASTGGDNAGKYIGEIKSPPGRWPANVIHDGSKEVTDLFPDTLKAGNIRETDNITAGNSIFGIGSIGRRNPKIEGDLGGSAARFFYCCKDKIELKDYLIKLVTPSGGITLDPFKGENMKDNYLLLLGKSEEVLKSLKDNSVDSIVTDPPYELGFMGKKWDNTGIAYNVGIWKECLRVLKPGGYLLSFGGTRTSHRMVCAIEDAGFEIRDTIMWIYGSGFPKSLDVSKAIDKAAGIEREKIATEAAKQWEGWGTALKPAHEPITVARKPFEGTVAQNVLEYGTGAINIDGCRVGVDPVTDASQCMNQNGGDIPQVVSPSGRWPANIIHDGSKEVTDLFLDTGKSSGGRNCNISKTSEIYGGGKGLGQDIDPESVKGDPGYGDIGSTARFFKVVYEKIKYCAKASKTDRNEGCEGGRIGNVWPTVKPTELMKYLVRLVTPPKGIILDPFCGSGSTGKAAMIEGFKFIGIDSDPTAIDIAKRRIHNASRKRLRVDIWENL